MKRINIFIFLLPGKNCTDRFPRMSRILSVLFGFVLLLNGCSESNGPAFIINEIKPTTGQPGTIVSIKGAGFASLPASNVVTFNGVPAQVLEASQTELKVSAPEGASRGLVEVRVEDETIQGPEFRFYNFYAYGSNFGMATYWKNGTEIQIPAPNSAITDMAISGSDVYASGWQMDGIHVTPECWKNGILKPLRGIDIATTSAIAVSDTNYHVVGSASFSSGTALYWKQGEGQILHSYHSGAGDIALNNNDVHILAGFSGESVHLLNGEVIQRFEALGDGMARIIVQDNIVHIAGSRNYRLAYWRDGVEQTYGPEEVRIQGLCVFGEDVYISGGIVDGSSVKAAYWKNGEPIYIENDQELSYATVEVTDDAIYILIEDSEGTKLYKNDEQITPDLAPTNDDRINGIMIEYY